MSNYVHLAVTEFTRVLDGCEKMSDVTMVQRKLADDLLTLEQDSCTQKTLDHVRDLSRMAADRLVELASQRKF